MTSLDSIVPEPFDLRKNVDDIILQEDRYPRNINDFVPWKARIHYYRKRGGGNIATYNYLTVVIYFIYLSAGH